MMGVGPMGVVPLPTPHPSPAAWQVMDTLKVERERCCSVDMSVAVGRSTRPASRGRGPAGEAVVWRGLPRAGMRGQPQGMVEI